MTEALCTIAWADVAQCHLVKSLNGKCFINYKSVDCWQIPNVLT